MSAVDYSLQIDEARETAICEVRGLSKSYRNFWLNDVSFKLEPGYIMGFVGRNGSGKSTTIKAMLRLVKPDCGEVKMFGMDYAENEEECKKHLGIVLGEFDYYADKKLKTVTGVVRRFYPEWDEAAYRRCIARFELDETKRVKELSAGMKVKYALALALSHNARLLILDEPTRGIDVGAKIEVYNLINELAKEGKAILVITSEIPELLGICDRVVVMARGRVSGTLTREEANQEAIMTLAVGAEERGNQK